MDGHEVPGNFPSLGEVQGFLHEDLAPFCGPGRGGSTARKVDENGCEIHVYVVVSNIFYF